MDKEPGGVIGKELKIKGDIVGNEDLLILGSVEGTIELNGELIIGDSGSAEVIVRTNSCSIHGKFNGEIDASDVISIYKGSNVSGNIKAPRIIIENEAVFNGEIDMDLALPEGI
jgi:cytoskeletal protein CcmA (bactofilin family)